MSLIPRDGKLVTRNGKVVPLNSKFLTRKLIKFFNTRKLFTALVLVPWLFFSNYILWLKTPEYQSTARILIEKTNLKENSGPLSMFVPKPPDSQNHLAREYIQSREVMLNLERRLGIKDHYQSSRVDILSRLSPEVSTTRFLTYFRKKISVVINTQTNELIVSATAFDPRMARRILNEVIGQTKIFVNRVSNTLTKKQYQFSSFKLRQAKAKLFDASRELIAWQNKNGFFDPKESAQVVSSVKARVKNNLVERETELITYGAFMQPNSNKILTIKEEINALKAQIKQQTSELLGQKQKNGKLNKLMSDFEWVQLQQKFAQAEYQAAQQAFDSAAVALSQTQNLLIEVEPANLPDEIASPRPVYDVTNVLIVLLILFLLSKMSMVIVREHID